MKKLNKLQISRLTIFRIIFIISLFKELYSKSENLTVKEYILKKIEGK